MSSLDELVVEAGRALGDGRRLFGASPVIAGGWSSTPALGFGRDGVAAAGQAAATGWGGGAAKTFGGANNGQLFALDGVLAGDGGTGAGLAGGGQAAAAGGGGMDGVITDTRSGVAAIAPATTTPAGKRELVTHLQGQLDRAKALLRVSERRNVELAKLIEQGSVGYGMMGATPMGGAAAMGAAPMGMGAAGGGAVGSPLSIPGLDTALAGLNHTHHHTNAEPSESHEAAIGGGGALARIAVKAALTRLGSPYVWGAKGPNQFDCSGLTHWAYAQAGITLGPDTYTQIHQGAPVARGHVEAGDLIFPHPGHVMLAISPTQCVEAQQSGVPVKISPMPASYVARRPAA
ncbi:putative endopeptidase [Mycobacterium persicum]|uniref:Endopeptidase n=1 Tax=Mycobacterium persicum TaxID=1487726 RepID=A0ABY6RS38_9MYCO|nr:NlpC/P60 family protein [Mycobacterium persicum]VBA32129.1 putative endopeptidase [Mycobacterium persicum]